MIKTTKTTGFQMAFANGLTISVQFGEINYSDITMTTPNSVSCPNAEVAAWDTVSGDWVNLAKLAKDGILETGSKFNLTHSDLFMGFQTSNQVAHWIWLVSNVTR